MEFLRIHWLALLLAAGGAAVVVLIVAVLIARAMGAKDVEVLKEAWSRIVCALYVLRWRPAFRGKTWLTRSIMVVVTVSAVYGFLDVAVITLKEILKTLEAGQMPVTMEFLNRLPHLPLLIDVFLLVLALVLLRHRIKEFRHHEGLMCLPAAISRIFDACRPSINVSATPAANRQALLDAVLTETMTTLNALDKRTVVATMFDVDSSAGVLKLTGCKPDGKYTSGMSLPISKSAAGAAVTHKIPVLVPSTRHLVAVNASTLESIDFLYNDLGNPKEAPETLLCLPLIKNGDVVAVMNVSVRPRRKYARSDMEIARLAATFVESTY